MTHFSFRVYRIFKYLRIYDVTLGALFYGSFNFKCHFYAFSGVIEFIGFPVYVLDFSSLFFPATFFHWHLPFYSFLFFLVSTSISKSPLADCDKHEEWLWDMVPMIGARVGGKKGVTFTKIYCQY